MKLTFITAVLAVAVVGCSSEHDGMHGPHHVPEVGKTACEGMMTSFDEYIAGIEKVGDNGLVSMQLIGAAPTPPSLGDNLWTMVVLDQDEQPLDDVAIMEVQPFMPDHGHGTGTVPRVQFLGKDGLCEVSELDLTMPGVWEVRFDLTTADQEADRVVFSFCVEG